MAQGRSLLRASGAGLSEGCRERRSRVGICVCEFQEQFGLGQSKVSYHLRVLKEAGLVNDGERAASGASTR